MFHETRSRAHLLLHQEDDAEEGRVGVQLEVGLVRAAHHRRPEVACVSEAATVARVSVREWSWPGRCLQLASRSSRCLFRGLGVKTRRAARSCAEEGGLRCDQREGSDEHQIHQEVEEPHVPRPAVPLLSE